MRDAEKAAEWKAKAEKARAAALVYEEAGVPSGMTVARGETVEGDEEQEQASEAPAPKRAPERKTKQQRRKAEKALAEVRFSFCTALGLPLTIMYRTQKRLLAENAAKRRLMASIPGARGLRRTLDRDSRTRQAENARRALAMREKLRRGLAGQQIGRHKVNEGEMDVQLGEELSETLRELKVCPFVQLKRDQSSKYCCSRKEICSETGF